LAAETIFIALNAIGGIAKIGIGVALLLLGAVAGTLLGIEFWDATNKLDLANATLGGITPVISLGAGLFLIAFGTRRYSLGRLP
jgi:hypothetical protein